MNMFYVVSRFPCWALGSFLFILVWCTKLDTAAERFLAAWDCVLRKNGFGGLRERFEDEVVFSHFNYIFYVFSAPGFLMNFKF